MGVEGMSEDRSMDGKKYGNKGLIHSEQIAYRRLIICQLLGIPAAGRRPQGAKDHTQDHEAGKL